MMNARLEQQPMAAVNDELSSFHQSLARELHDELGQELILIKLFSERILRSSQLGAAQEYAQQILCTLDKTHQQVRGLLQNIKSPVPEDVDFRQQVTELVAQWQASSQLEVSFSLEGDVDAMPRDHAHSIYRLLQEGLTNVGRHAQATAVTITVCYAPDLIQFALSDNGRGMSSASGQRIGLGLTGMRDRVQALGGQFEINQHAGTHINALFPLVN